MSRLPVPPIRALVGLATSTLIGAALTSPGTATPTAVRAEAATNGQLAVAVEPDDGRSTEFSGPGHLATFAKPSGAPKTIVGGRGHDLEAPEYSPDGKRIAWFEQGTKPGIYVAAADGTGARRLAKNEWAIGLTWTADGKTIVFTDITTSGMLSVPADGSGKAKPFGDSAVDDLGGYFVRPSASPDGRALLVEHMAQEEVNTGDPNPSDGPDAIKIDRLERLSAEGISAGRLLKDPKGPKFSREPDWSPDATHVTFDGGDDLSGRLSVYTAAADGTGVKTIWTAPSKQWWIDGPVWSPDAKTIVFAAGRKPAQGSKLITVDVATGKAQTVQRLKSGWFLGPSWQPLR